MTYETGEIDQKHGKSWKIMKFLENQKRAEEKKKKSKTKENKTKQK